MKKALLILSLLFVSVGFIYAQYEFIENRGQWENNIKFKTELQNGAIFIENNCLTYNFIENTHDHGHGHEHEITKNGKDPHNPNLPKILHGHAYKVNFLNSNIPTFSTNQIKSDYVNYFISNEPSKWQSGVQKYGEIIYNDIYNNIDVRYYNAENGLKYDFILHPNADVENIKMEYEGVDKIFEQRGNIVIKTSLNTVKEGKPFAYQIINRDTIKINCSYKLENNVVSFKLSNKYDKTKDLIIDPSLIFSTYTGSTADNWGFTATWDYEDNVYSGGIAFSVGYPVSTGAYQINYGGGYPGSYGFTCDVAIIKYNPIGSNRLFATYLGGATSEDMPHSLVVNEENELIIMGTTGSSDFPTTPNCFDNSFNGGNIIVYDNVLYFQNGIDIFVSKLSLDGKQLKGSTFVGGSDNDGLNFRNRYGNPDPVSGQYIITYFGNDSLFYNYADGARGEVVVDSRGDIFVGTTTFSTDFPQGINPGYQTTNHGKQEGILFKLSGDLTQLIWSSYLGGSNDDAVFSITLNKDQDILVTGGTTSTNFPVTPGAYKTTYNGGSTDAFVSKFNSMGNVLMASTYYGSSNYDNGYFVRCDGQNNNYICGQTCASGSTLIHNAGYSKPNSGQFIAEFNPNLSSLLHGTVFGTGNGKPNISLTAFEVDVCNRIYISGWGREWPQQAYNSSGNMYSFGSTFGTVGMEVTPNALYSTTDGQDFYIIVLGNHFSTLDYATFFGEILGVTGSYSNPYGSRDHVDGGTSRFDKRGNVIQSVCGSCNGSQNFPISPNAWSSVNNSANCNNAVFKISIIDNLALANFNPVPVGCAPYNVTFVNNSQGQTFFWDFGDGTTSTQKNPTHLYPQGGKYTIRLIVTDPSSCNIKDTVEREIYVVSASAQSLPNLEVCAGQNIIIGPANSYPNGTTFQWSGGTGLSSYSLKNPVASPTVTTTYQLIAKNVCNDTVLQTVEVKTPNIPIITSPDTTICAGGTVNLSASSSSIVSNWQWSSSPSFSTIIANSQSTTVSPTASGTYYVRATESTCNYSSTAYVQVTIHNFNISTTPNPFVCYGNTTTIAITNNNSSDNLSYQWNTGATTNSINVNPLTQTNYTVTITNQIGCVTTRQISVNVDYMQIATPLTVNNLCYGDCSGSVTITPVGTSPYIYLWNNGNTTSSSNSLCAGSYTVTVTDAHQCTAATTFSISTPSQLIANFINVQQPICDGVGYGSASVSASGGTPSYTYNWSFNNNSQSSNNQLLIGTNYVTVTDSHNCKEVISINMLSPSDLTSTYTTTPVKCFGNCDGSVTIAAQLGIAPYTYVWANGLNPSLGATVQNLCSGQYIVTVLDHDNCVYHQIVEVTQPSALLAEVSVLSPIAFKGGTGSLKVKGIGGTPTYSYLWNNNVSDSILSDLAIGTYSVTTTDYNGCTYFNTFTLTEPPQLESTYQLKNMSCTNSCNGKITAFPSGGTSPFFYKWSNSDNRAETSSLCDGKYYLTITDARGCVITSDFLIINELHVPDLTVTADTTLIYVGQEVHLYAHSSESGYYIWQQNNSLSNLKISNPTAKPTSNTTYLVTFVSTDNCYTTDTIAIKVKDLNCTDPYIFIPTAFTPDDNAKNDYFKPYFPSAMIREAYFAVYDRWGNIIYESKDINCEGWDGTYKGQKIASDVYAFYFHALCINGEEYNHRGNVTLLR